MEGGRLIGGRLIEVRLWLSKGRHTLDIHSQNQEENNDISLQNLNEENMVTLE